MTIITPKPKRPLHRRERLDVHFTQEMMDRSRKKAKSLVRLRAAVRVLVKHWIDGNFEISEQEILSEMLRARRITVRRRTDNVDEKHGKL